MPSPTSEIESPPLTWSTQLTFSHATADSGSTSSKTLSGDKILLPPSALEELLAASAKLAADQAARENQTSPNYFASSRSTFPGFSSNYGYQDESRDLNQQNSLPHPLTFRLVNPANGRAVYAGIREFSANEGDVGLSPFLQEALGIERDLGHASTGKSGVKTNGHIPNVSGGGDVVMKNGDTNGFSPSASQSSTTLTIHAKQLPKGTYVKLRPLEAGYDPDDWKALLEQHLRQNYTTFTNGEVLVVPGVRGVSGKKEEFRFLIDGFKPESAEAICIVDTDLEVDIEALNEEQARETLARIAEKIAKAPGTKEGSSAGGDIDLFRDVQGQVLPGEYVDYTLPSWNRTQVLEIALDAADDEEMLDLLVTPFSATQRSKPRIDEFVFADLDARPGKRIRLEPRNVEMEEAEALRISVHAATDEDSHESETPLGNSAPPIPKKFTLRARHPNPDQPPKHDTPNGTAPNEGDVQCKNCLQWVPQRTLMLHENFCLRNNILCPQGCGQVFQKRSPEYQSHWHCPHDSSFGNNPPSLHHHNTLFHPASILHCPDCTTRETFSTTPLLAHHRTTTCPAKLILCRFCHLEVPQDGDPDTPNPEALLSGLTPHELLDGSRTTECHLCNKITRLRDMPTHLRSHDLDRLSRPAPIPCRNILCGRTLDGARPNGDTRPHPATNDLALCAPCFAPLYVSLHDPDGKHLRRRLERRYLHQLLAGCDKPWCRNEWCKSGRTHLDITPHTLSTKDALPQIKPFLQTLFVPRSSADGEASLPSPPPLHFCTDQPAQSRRDLAGLLAAEGMEVGGRGGKAGGYALNWCLAALEACENDADRAAAWLRDWAPTRKEEEGRR